MISNDGTLEMSLSMLFNTKIVMTNLAIDQRQAQTSTQCLRNQIPRKVNTSVMISDLANLPQGRNSYQMMNL